MADKLIIEEFDSIHQLLATIKSRPANSVFRGAEDSITSRDASFYGTHTMEEAEELLRFGWNEHTDEIMEKVNANVKTNEGTLEKRRPINSVVGFAPHVPNAIRGIPESMISATSTKQKVKAVTIVYNHSVLGSWSTDSILRAGISILKLVNQIERKNVRVKLVSEFKSSTRDGEIAIGRVVLKNFKDQLDIKKITFPFANAAMQRRIGFRWTETQPDITVRGWRSTQGSSLGDTWDYNRIVKMLKDNNRLKDNEYYLTAKLARDCNFDTDRIIEKLNIKM